MELLQLIKSRRGGELIGVVFLMAGVLLAVAVLTYTPSDSSAFHTSANGELSNAIGYFGATIAWLFVSFFGLASLLFPAVLLVIGWNRLAGKDIEYLHTKLLGFLILVAVLPALLDLALNKLWFRGSLIPSGGYIGSELRSAIASNFNTIGAAIVLVTALLIGLLLSTRFSLAVLFLSIREGVLSLGRALSLRWARLLERRRKDRMKSEVVIKHLERAKKAAASAPVAPAEELCETNHVIRGVVVREVSGQGKFQIRKVTKADLRKAAEDLATERRPIFIDDIEPSRPPVRPPSLEDDFDEIHSLPRPKATRAPQKPQPRRTQPAPRVEAPVSEPNLSSERLPYTSLLKQGPQSDGIDDDSHRKFLETGRLIEERCREFSVEGDITAYHPGPVVTTFEFKPSAGVKYAKVVNLGDDLALALKAESIRIERISGSSTVGIEVPNRKRDLIALRDIIDSEVFNASPSMMTLALGKDIHGDPIVTDLARMPHLLVAGATGAGKSVGLNSMIVSMLYKALPKQLRFLMIDPKMVELKMYEDIPHLLHPIVTDPKLASNALIWAVQEMENRYRLLAGCGVRNIDQFNALLKDPEAMRRARKDTRPDDPIPESMHYIVIIIDEFADLMMVASKDVEDSVTRIAQKARAVGIHLIVATQRPSVDVITGVIKANFPSRLSFQVASRIDSRTILDAQGAEKLLGNGDMLFLPPGTARLRRIHGAYVSEKEITDIVEFVKKNQGRPNFLEEITKSPEEKSGIDGIEYLSDPKYDEAVRTVLSTGQASASYLQRRMKLGYSRAARLIEIMEANGILGPSQGSKPREILIRADDYPGMDDASSL